jgi:hypothetical protein
VHGCVLDCWKGLTGLCTGVPPVAPTLRRHKQSIERADLYKYVCPSTVNRTVRLLSGNNQQLSIQRTYQIRQSNNQYRLGLSQRRQFSHVFCPEDRDSTLSRNNLDKYGLRAGISHRIMTQTNQQTGVNVNKLTSYTLQLIHPERV